VRECYERQITLMDGTAVGSWSQEWLIECRDRHLEALKVLGFATKEVRQDHLAKYEARLGAEARRRLDAEIMRVWELRRAELGIEPAEAAQQEGYGI
jgi:hypothetical protein